MTDAILRITGRDETKGAFDSVRRNLAGVKQEAGGVADAIAVGMTRLGPLAAAIGAAFTGATIKGAIDLGDQLDDLSEKTGITVESLSALRYAGEVAGTPIEAMATGIRKLSQNMSAAAGGAKEQQAVFKALGVSLTQLDGSLRNTDDVLGDVADKFASFRDGPEKAALAMQLFGKSGADMIPFLNRGREGIATLKTEAEQLGAVVGANFAKQSAQFNDSLKKVELSAEAAKIALAGDTGLLSGLNKVIEAFLTLRRLGSLELFIKEGFKGPFGDLADSNRSRSVSNISQRLAGQEAEKASEQAFIDRVNGQRYISGYDQLLVGNAEKRRNALQSDIEYSRRLLNVAREFQQIELRNDGVYDIEAGDFVSRRYLSKPAGKTVAPIVAKEEGNVANRALDAQLEGIKARDRVVQALAKQTADTIESEVKRGVKSQLNGLEEIAAVQIAAMGSTRASLVEQLAISEKKDKGEKESAALRGQIAEADARMAALGVKYQNDYLEALDKRKAAAEAIRQAESAQASEEWRQAIVANSKANIDAGLAAYGYARAVNDANDQLTFELGLMGQSERARLIANEQRRVEITLREKLRALDESTLLTADQKLVIERRLRETAARDMATAESRVVLQVWDQTTQQINASLTDALLRGFEDGKGFAENFRDTFKNMFNTLVLRPVIQAALAPVSGALAGVAGSVQGGGVGGTLNTASNAASLYSGLTGYSSGVNTAASLLGAGGTAGASALSMGYANAVGAVGGDALGAMIAANGSWGGVAAGTAGATAAGGGAMAALGAAAPYLAVAAIVLSALMKKGGGPKQDGRFGAGLQTDIGTGDNSLLNGVKPTVEGLQKQYDALVQQFGGKGGVQFGVAISRDPKGDAPTFLEVAGTRDGKNLFSNLNRDVGRSDEDLANALATASVDALIGALKASDLDKVYADFFDQVATDASTEAKQAALVTIQAVQSFSGQFGLYRGVFEKIEGASIEARAALIKAAGGIDTLTASAGSAVEGLYTDEERRNALWRSLVAEFQRMNVVLPSSTKGFRALIDGLDPTKDRDLIAKLLALSGAFTTLYGTADDAIEAGETAREKAEEKVKDNIKDADDLRNSLWSEYDREVDRLIDAAQRQAESFRDVADSLGEYRRELVTSAVSPVNLAAQKQLARGVLDDLATRAPGDSKAASQLQGAAQSYLDLSRRTSRNVMEYGSDFWYVQRLLSVTQAAMESSADEADATVRELKGQRSDLAALIGVQVAAQSSLNDIAAQLRAMGKIGTAPVLGGGAPASGNAATAAVEALYQGILGRNSDPGGLQFYLDSGWSVSQIASAMQASDEHKRIYGFAGGGDHGGGWRIVGELGPELEATGPARYFNYEQTRRLLDGNPGQASAANDASIRDLNNRLGTQEAFLHAIAKSTLKAADGADLMERWEKIGMPPERTGT